MAKFTERRMKPNESLATYSHELNRLLNEAMPSINGVEKQAIVRSQIITHAPNDMKEMLKLSATLGGEAFTKYVNQCDSTISFQTSTSLIKDEPVDVNYMNTNSGARNNYNNNYNRSQRGGYTNTASKISNGSNANNYFDGVCYNCDERGHRLVDCPSRAAEIKATMQQQRNYNNQRNNNSNSSGTYRNNNNYNQNSNKRGSSNSYINNSQKRADANNNNVEAAQETNENTQNEFQFPWYNNAEHNMTEMVEVTSIETKLLKITTQITLFGSITLYPLTLLDCGSNYSFISPAMFDAKNMVIMNDNSQLIETKQFKINGAIGGPAICTCKVVNAKIKIGSWEGSWKFVISDLVNKHEV